MNGETNLTNGDDKYTTIMDGENIFALDGNDIINISHQNITVNGGAGDDVFRFNSDDHIFGIYGNPANGDVIDTILEGGDGYDMADFQVYWIPGLDVDVTLDVTGIDFTDVEEISLQLVVHPTDPGPGGAGGFIFDDFFDINYSQLATISHLDIYNNLAWEIHFTSADTVIDLRNFTVANDHGAYLYNFDNIDKLIYLDNIHIFEGLLAAGQDTIYVTYDPTEFWQASFYEWEANTSGNDVLDFSLMTTVDDGMGGTLGTLTHEMHKVTQSGFGLASDSYINISKIDAYYGWDGKDIFIGDSRDNYFDGNGGTDIAVYSSADASDYTVTEIGLGEYTVQAIGGTGEGTDTLTSIEAIRLGGINGTDYAIGDLVNAGTINLTNGDDVYSGTPNDVVINALDGNDIIDGGTGNNTLNGDGGNDTLISLGNDILNGGTGNDLIEMGGNIFDVATTTDGGADIDTISFSTLAQLPSGNLFLVVDLQGQAYSVHDGSTLLYVDQFTNFENATGSEFADLLQGDAGTNVLLGLGGDDNLQGRDGNDIIEGGAGDDILNGDAGDDILYGGTGNNTYNGGDGDDTLISGGSFNVFDGGAGIDTLSYAETTGTVLVDLLTGATGNAAFGDSFSGIENITSAIFGGILRGDSSDNVLIGSGFVDTLVGRNGNDTLIGEAGDDTLQGGRGEDILFGGAGDDTLEGAQSSEVDNDFAVYLSIDPADYIVTHLGGVTYSVQAVSTNEGTDTLTGIDFIRLGGLDGTDYAIETLVNNVLTINLTEGVDVFSGTEADEIINALGNHDTIDGGGGNNTLNGDAGNDTLISLGNDILNGGRGNDTIEMGGNIFDASTATDGGTGIDTLSFSTLAQLPSGNLFLVLDLQGQAYSVRDGSTVLYVDQFVNFENATGSQFGDLLQGDAGVNVLMGLGGDDNLHGRDGDDVIDGGAGADILNGGVGADTASYASALAGVTAIMGDAALNTGDAVGDNYIDIENITGSDFDDVLGGDVNSNVIDGGAGVDIASYAYAASAIVFDGLGLVAGSGDIVDDTFLNIEGIGGTSFGDRLFGDNGASIFYGGEGNDRLFGRNGDDQLFGEGGNDIILAGRDNDLLDGGDGNDQLRGNEGDDTLLGGDGNDVLAGGAGADVLDGGAGIDRVEYTYGTNAGVTASLGDSSINTGDAMGDTYVDIENLYGTSFTDTLYGDAGNNRIDGRVGDDALFGGDGNDYLIGGSGDDVMNGEGGNDLLLGQAGADIYQFDAAHGTDRIIIFTQGEDLIEFTESVFDFSGLTITQDGAHVDIDTGEGMIIVNNSLVADFTSDDFIFAAPAQEPLDMSEQDMAIYMEIDALI